MAHRWTIKKLDDELKEIKEKIKLHAGINITDAQAQNILIETNKGNKVIIKDKKQISIEKK